MTDISVTSVAHQVEQRPWLLSPHGTDPGTTLTVTLDISAFTAATHYPNGYIPSGCVLGRNGDLWEPYDGGEVEGGHVDTEATILYSSVKVPDSGANVGGAGVVHTFVDRSKLPFADGAGSLGAGGEAALPLIHFAG